MPSKEDYEAMHADAMESLSAIEEMQRGLAQLTGNIQRLSQFSQMLTGDKPDKGMDEDDDKSEDKDEAKRLAVIKLKRM